MSKFTMGSDSDRMYQLHEVLEGHNKSLFTDSESIRDMLKEFAGILSKCTGKRIKLDIDVTSCIQDYTSVEQLVTNDNKFKSLNTVTIKKIKSMLSSGMTQSEVAKQLNISRNTVIKYK